MTPQDLVLTKSELTKLAEKINSEHAACEASARQALQHALAVGEMLIEVKQLVGHGRFGDWVAENCAVTARQARKYMTLARELPRRLDEDPKRNCDSDLTVAGALRLVGESSVPPESILRLERKTRHELINDWPDIRWSRFTAFSAAGYPASEIGLIFNWSEEGVIAELQRLKEPKNPDRRDWFDEHGLAGEHYQDRLRHDVLEWRRQTLQAASYSALRDLGRRNVANRLQAEADALSDEGQPVAWFGADFEYDDWQRLAEAVSAPDDDEDHNQLRAALMVCSWSDYRAAIGLESVRPMDELFSESLAMQVELAAIRHEERETGIAIPREQQEARLDALVARLAGDRNTVAQA